MNILIMRPRLEQGGVRRFIELLGEGLVQRGHHVAVVCGEDELPGGLAARGMAVHVCPLHPSSVGNLARSVGPLCSLVRAERIDILLSTHRFTTVVGKLVSRITGAPLIVTLHERSRNLGRLAGLWTGQRTVVPSQALKDDLVARLGRDPGRIAVIPNGILVGSAVQPAAPAAQRAALGLRPDLPVVGYVGRLSPEKGVANLLESVSLLRDRGVLLQTLIVGDGVEGPQLQERCRRLQIEDRVLFAGSRTDAPDLMALMDIVAVPSLQESFGLVALEAMRAGRPVVATRVGGLPELIEDGVSGLLVPPASPAAFAAALAELLAHPARGRAMGEAGRRTLETHYAADAMIERYLDLFAGVIHA